MDRIGMGFGPISDVTGFSHKGGMTFLEIQEILREKINELVAAYGSLKSHVESRNGDLISAFADTLDDFTTKFNAQEAAMVARVDGAIANLSAPADEYAGLVAQFNAMVVEFESMIDRLGANTMTDEEIASALGV